MNIEDVMDFLVDHSAPSLPPAALVDVFDSLVSCLDDTGAELDEVAGRWLVQGDRRRTEIALARRDSFPARDRDKLIRLLGQVSHRFPDLEEQTQQAILRWDPAWVTNQFHLLAREAGLPPIRLHDLRHGAASIALAAGVDVKVVSEMLGHSGTAIMQDIYIPRTPALGHGGDRGSHHAGPFSHPWSTRRGRRCGMKQRIRICYSIGLQPMRAAELGSRAQRIRIRVDGGATAMWQPRSSGSKSAEARPADADST